MKKNEACATLGVASVLALRMLGMFLILPVFSLYGKTLPGGDNHVLLGLALGVYGLTQACLQIPMGKISDRFGRKPTIYVGLAIFALGSFIASIASDIYWVVAGRAVQGVGAISAVLIALLADLTSEKNRTIAMAIIGITIGVSFVFAIFIGPLLAVRIGVPGIFFMTGILALAGVFVVRYFIPDPPGEKDLMEEEKVTLKSLLYNRELLKLNAGIFFLHAILVSLFLIVPFVLESHLTLSRHWLIYLFIMFGSVVFMAPAIYFSEKVGCQNKALNISILLVGISCALLAHVKESLVLTVIALIVFFSAFNLLEASLPSLASKRAPAGSKGSSMGVYSTFQFLGMFLGALVGGSLAQAFGGNAIFYFCGFLAFIWLVCVSNLRVVKYQ